MPAPVRVRPPRRGVARGPAAQAEKRGVGGKTAFVVVVVVVVFVAFAGGRRVRRAFVERGANSLANASAAGQTSRHADRQVNVLAGVVERQRGARRRFETKATGFRAARACRERVDGGRREEFVPGKNEESGVLRSCVDSRVRHRLRAVAGCAWSAWPERPPAP